MTMVPTRDQRPRLAGPVGKQSAGGEGGGGLTPQDILRIVRKRLLMILLTVTIVMVVTVVGTLIWRQYYPFYRAEALLRVEAPRETALDRAFIPSKEAVERSRRSMARLVRSRDVLEAAVSGSSELQDTSWFKRNEDNIIVALERAIKVSVVPEENFIKLSMTGTNKKELATIVNAVSIAFVERERTHARRGYREQIVSLEEQKAAIDDEIAALESGIASARGAGGMDAMQERRSEVTIKMELLLRKISVTRDVRVTAEAALAAWQQREETRSDDPNILRALDVDPILRQLQSQLTQYKALLANARRKFGPKHRQVLDYESLIKSVEQEIAERTQTVIATESKSIGQLLDMQAVAATTLHVSLLEESRSLKSEAKDIERRLGQIGEARRKQVRADGRLRRVELKLQDLKALGGTNKPGDTTGPVEVRQRAFEPDVISSPRWVVTVPTGILLGLLLGFGLAFLVELADTSVKSPSDISRRLDIPLLGMVPHGDDLEEEIADFRRVVLEAPHSLAAEAFRQIRTNLLFSGPAEQRRSLLVTSPAPEDGRTSVVMNLAAAVAMAGRRVLVVDANFRQPAIGAMFPDIAEAGLSSALVGQANWKDVVSSTGMPNFDVMAAGPLPPNPAELLGSESMRTILAEMSAEYDQVIFDGSPVMVVTDACVLSTQVDGVILVVRAGHNSIGIVRKAVGQLRRIGAHVLGAVLQGVRTTAGGYLRKNYEAFYEYHQGSLPE